MRIAGILGGVVLVLRGSGLLGVIRRRWKWFSSRPVARPRRCGGLGGGVGEIRDGGLPRDGLAGGAITVIVVNQVKIFILGVVGTRCTIAVPRARPVGGGGLAGAVLGHGSLRARGCGLGGVHRLR